MTNDASHNLKADIKKVMVEHLDLDENAIHDTTSFSKELGLDSLDAIDLLMAVDEALGIRIPAKEMSGVDNLEQLALVVSSQAHARDN